MTPSAAIAQLRGFLLEVGENVVFRRYAGSGSDRPKTDVTIRARVVDYDAREIIGPVQMGDRKVIALADTLSALLPLRAGTGNDVIIARGRELQIISVDDNTRRIAGVLVGLELQVRGK